MNQNQNQNIEKYYNFVNTADQTTIDQWLGKLDAMYYIGQRKVTDEVYDHLVRLYEERFGKRTVVGSHPTNNKIKLPIAMMSLDKIMKEKELNNWVKKNPGPYVIMDKIDGNAGLYEVKYDDKKVPTVKLYNRGDGTMGSDLSHIIKYLNLPLLSFDAHVKGELVIDKKDYEPYKNDYRTNLSMIAGLLNSKSADPERLKLIKFVAYDISFPKHQNIELTCYQSLQQLVKYKFQIPYNIALSSLSIKNLSYIYNKQKKDASYNVDGVAIVSNRPIKYKERTVRENPKYSVAFKEYGKTVVATVKFILWEASKHNVIKPVVKIEPIKIGSSTIRSLTAFNAGWVDTNKVGPGTKILIAHNTIPVILSVLSSTYAQMPDKKSYPKGWHWNETHVDIFLMEANDEVKIARIYEFFKQIEAKYLGENTLAKFYHAGFDTVKIMLESTKEDFMDANIEGVGEGIIDRIILSIKTSLPKTSLSQLMSASGVFGLGFGNRKITAILDVYPNILDLEPTVDDIEAVEGFANKTAQRFVDNLPKFRKFVADIPIIQDLIEGRLRNVGGVETGVGSENILNDNNNDNDKQKIEQNLAGKSVVFTGFRDKGLEANIKSRGGSVKTGVSKKIDYVLVGGKKGAGSSKETKAIEYGIPVLSVAEFKSQTGIE